MQPLDFPNQHYLSAAIGWLELGNLAECRRELERIDVSFREHPEVIETQWRLLAQQESWDQAVMIARDLVRHVPDRPSGWLQLAYSLRRSSAGGLDAAREVLLSAHEKFPDEATIVFNLACYACRRKHLEESLRWLHKAIRLAGKKQIVAMALEDPDLETLWGEIHRL